jgi:hypothetical protein
MSRELEARLERALSRVGPSEAVTEQARAAALDALPRGLRVRHRAILLIAAALTALALAGGALAASETAREVVGIGAPRPASKPPAPIRAALPAGASGFATVVGDHVWIARPGAARAREARFTAFELSPNAVYVAAGSGRSLAARQPATLRATKRVAVRGTVTAIGWAPIGIYIAYVVRTAHGSDLHLMEGNFTNDRIVARGVADVRPSWRWDSLAVAYARADGSVRVLDLGQGRTVAVRAPACAAGLGVRQLAFAPYGGRLAVAGTLGAQAWIADIARPGPSSCIRSGSSSSAPGPALGGGLAWLTPRDLVVTAWQFITRVHLEGGRVVYGRTSAAPAGINAVAAAPDRRSLAVALGDGRVVIVDVPANRPPAATPDPVHIRQVLLNLPDPQRSAPSTALLWR